MSETHRIILIIFGTLLGVLLINVSIISVLRNKTGYKARQYKVISRAINSIKNPLSEDSEEMKKLDELSSLVQSFDQSEDSQELE